MKKKISLMIAILVIMGGAGIGQTSNHNAYAKSDDMTLGQCVKGIYELDTFFETVISFHGFFENFVEYWKDIVGRNECHSFDVLMLDKQQDKIKTRIQDAFLKCNNEKIPALEKAYYKLDAEIFYVRRLVSSSLSQGISLGFSSADDEVDETKFTDLNEIYAEMKTLYPPKFDGDTAFNSFFNSLNIKYSQRKYSYLNCPDNSWTEVSEKFKEFIENVGGLKTGVEGAKKNVNKEIERLKRNATMGPPSSFKSILESSFKMKVNDLNAEDGFDEILDRAEELMPGNSTPNLGAVFNATSRAREQQAALVERVKLREKYTLLYKNTSDATIEEFLDSISELESVVEETINYIDGTDSCVWSILNKQCP